MMKNNLDQAAVQLANEILSERHVSVAESIQLLLMYITDNEGKDMAAASVSYIKGILDLVCESTEASKAVL